MDRRQGLSAREVLISVLLAAALVAAVFPGVVFGGASIFSTDAIFAVEPWRSEAPAAQVQGRPHNAELGDHDFQFFPLLVEIQRQIHEGERAVWTPYAYAGAPLAANVQLALWDPFHVLLPFFQEREIIGEGRGDFSIAAVSRGLSITGLLRLLLCLVFAYLWLRRVGAPIPVAAAAALFLGLGPYPSLWRLHTPEQVYSLWPVALFFLDGLARRARFVDFAGFSLALAASQLGGYPQTSLFFSIFALAYVCVRAEPKARRGRVVELVVAGLLAAIMCAPLWIPWFAYAQEGVFSLQREELPWISKSAGLGTGSVVAFLGAGLLAGAFGFATLFARVNPWIRGGFAALACVAAWVGGADGQAPLLLASELRGNPLDAGGVAALAGERAYLEMVQDHLGVLFAFVLLAGASRALVRALAIALVVSSSWPFVEQGLRFVVPWLAPSRAASLVPLIAALALVQAVRKLGLRTRDERAASLRAVARGLLSFAATYALLGFVLSFHAEGARAFGLHGYSWGSVLGFALVLGIAAVPASARWAGHASAPLALGALACLLACSVAWNFQPRIAPDDVYPRTPTIDFLVEACRQDPDARVFATAGDAFRGNALQTYRIPDIFAADGIEPAGVMGYLINLDFPEVLGQRGSFRARDLSMLGTPLFDVLGARYVVMQKGDVMPAHFRVVHEAKTLIVAENTHAAPRAWLTIESYNLDADKEALIRRPIHEHVGLRAGSAPLEGPRMKRGTVEVALRRPDRLALDVEADGEAWLVVRDTMLAGWSATLRARGGRNDDREARRLAIEPAFGAFRAVRVPAGQHRVEFRHQPIGWPRMTLLALLVAMLLGLGAALVLFFRMTIWPFLRVQEVKKAYQSKSRRAS